MFVKPINSMLDARYAILAAGSGDKLDPDRRAKAAPVEGKQADEERRVQNGLNKGYKPVGCVIGQSWEKYRKV